MSGSIEALLAHTVAPFIPLRMGSLTVGWVSQHRAGFQDEISLEGRNWLDESDWFLAVDDKLLPFYFSPIITQCNNEGIEVAREVSWSMMYDADFILQMPVGSVDITDWGCVDYTGRTIQHVFASLSNFILALKSDVQDRLNNEDAEEAVKFFDRLLRSGYPFTDTLLWRGRSLKELGRATS